MKREKTWVSYPLWLVFAILTGIYIAVPLWRCGNDIWKIDRYLTAAVIGLVFCAAAGIWFAGRQIVHAAGRKAGNMHGAGHIEYVLLLVLCGAALACRLYLFGYFSGSTGGSVYYETALVKAGGGVPWNAHGASYLYTMFLSFVLSFSGNKVTAGVILQLVLQMIALPFVYFAVKFLAGRGEAVCALAVTAFSPSFCNRIFFLTPETLYFLLYVFGWFLCGLYWRGLCRQKKKDGAAPAGNAGKRRWYVRTALYGCYIGFAGFLDAAGWTLLPMFLFLCIKGGRRKEAGEEGKAAIGMRQFMIDMAVVFLAALFSFFLFLGVFGLPAVAAGQSYGKVLSLWQAEQIRNFSFSVADIHSFFERAASFSGLHLAACVCAAFAVVGFWFRKEQKQDWWIIVLLVLEVFQVFRIGGMEYGMFLTAVWGIFAGIGICSMGMERETETVLSAAAKDEGAGQPEARNAEKEDKAEEKIAEKMEKPEGKKVEKVKRPEERKAEEVKKPETKKAEKVKKPEGKKVEKVEKKEETGQAGKQSAAEEKSAGGERNVKLIENPLPLPKKHVKREMTYAKEVKGEEMDFDIAVAEDDDFDI